MLLGLTCPRQGRKTAPSLSLSLSLKATAAAAAATFEKADETFFDRQENGCLVADCVKRQEARRPQPTSGTCIYDVRTEMRGFKKSNKYALKKFTEKE